MATAEQYRIPPSERDDSSAETAASEPIPGNDNAEAGAEADAEEALVRSRQRTWHIFVRALLLSALLAGLVIAAVVPHMY